MRMIYQVTMAISIPGTTTTEYHSFRVANYQNAEAIQSAFKNISTIDVSIEPDVFTYLSLSATRVAA